MTAPAQVAFVKSLFASRIFWTQAVAFAAIVASAAGYHIIDAPGVQEQLVGALDALFTIYFRLNGPNGPVSLTGPVSVPDPVDIHAGSSVVSVPTPAAIELQHTTTVQPLADAIHTVDATLPVAEVYNPRQPEE